MLDQLALGDGRNLGTVGGQIALDCSVRETRQGHFVISTTDFFFPIVPNPYLQGRIGAANVLSDLYAEGVVEVDYMLVLLAACRNMPPEERDISTREMMRGFRDACREAGAPITGGQTVLNPWPIIGGVATAIVSKDEYIKSDGAQLGDVVVLTKPLGTQVAANVFQWKEQRNERWQKCSEICPEELADNMVHKAFGSMARLNRHASRLMLECGAHAATDVTGFGILGHAQNLISNQAAPDLGLELHTLPCFEGTAAVNSSILDFGLLRGTSAETSGGLLVCLPEDKASTYIEKLEKLDQAPAWIVGRIVYNPARKAQIVDGFQILQV